MVEAYRTTTAAGNAAAPARINVTPRAPQQRYGAGPTFVRCSRPMNTEDDAIIRQAIAERRLVRFSLHGQVRVAEPHDYGIRTGEATLLVYQVAGESRSGKLPNWRWVVLSHASGFAILDQTFAGGRDAPSGHHSPWETLFARVERPR